MLPAPPDGLEVDAEAIDILAQVSLESFRATPTSIGPFGSSVLEWRAEGPPTGWGLILDGRSVARSGAIAVRPQFSRSYGLSARARRYARSLGSVRVDVDLDACETNQFFDFRWILDGALRQFVENDPELRFRTAFGIVQYPSIEFEPDRISFSLRLKKSQDNFPDPSVNIDVRFGLAVADEAIVVSPADINVDISVPWYAWTIPGAVPALAIAISMARDGARQRVRASLDQLAAGVAFLLLPSDRRPHSIRILPGENNEGVLELLHCPDAELGVFLGEDAGVHEHHGASRSRG